MIGVVKVWPTKKRQGAIIEGIIGEDPKHILAEAGNYFRREVDLKVGEKPICTVERELDIWLGGKNPRITLLPKLES